MRGMLQSSVSRINATRIFKNVVNHSLRAKFMHVQTLKYKTKDSKCSAFAEF
jgi:hypothetical protein